MNEAPSTAGLGPSLVPEDQMADALRILAMDAVRQANSGHQGMPMGMVDVAAVLSNRFVLVDPADRRGPTAIPWCSWPVTARCCCGIHHLVGYEAGSREPSRFPRGRGAPERILPRVPPGADSSRHFNITPEAVAATPRRALNVLA